MSPRWRRDANHAEVADIWQRYGWLVVDTSRVGSNAVPGFPDLLVVRWPLVLLVEIKHGKSATLTDDESAFAERIGTPPYVVCRGVEEAHTMARRWREMADMLRKEVQ